MIISGYKPGEEEDRGRVDEALVRELAEKDAELAEKLRKKNPITEQDVEAARQRITEEEERIKYRLPEPEDKAKSWDFLESLREHPLYNRRGRNRTVGAQKMLFDAVPLYSGYLIPGQVAWFRYDDPKTADKLEWFDRTPCVIFFGYIRNAQGKIRELGFNLHYFPPFTRKNIMQRVFRLFKTHFLDNFSVPAQKKISGLTYRRMLASLRSSKLEVGVREYIPGLRSGTRVIPTEHLPTACLTEGEFEGSTVREIYNYWKSFAR